MERVMLSHDEAVAMLPDGDDIHTFRNCALGMMIGCDMSRSKLIKHMKKNEPVELSGEMATSMKHGMVLHDQDGWLFIATKEPEGD